MRLRGLLRMLMVDDSIMDEIFELTPAEVDDNSGEDKGKGKETSQARKKYARGAIYSLRLKGMRVAYGERHEETGMNWENDTPDRSLQGRAVAKESSKKQQPEKGSDFAQSRSQQDSKRSSRKSRPLLLGYKEVKPFTLAELRDRAHSKDGQNGKRTWKGSLPRYIQYDLASNRMIIERIFHLPLNADIVLRDFRIGGKHSVPALAVFVDGLADKTIINTHILEPLMLLSSLEQESPRRELVDWVKAALLPGNQVMEFTTWKDATENILAGSTVLFVEGIAAVLGVETKGWEHRTVTNSRTESVVLGPQDAFTESFRANTGLVRSKLRSTRLITEIQQIGKLASTDVAVMYLEGVVNPKIVKEIKRRIEAVDVDYVPDSGLLQQFLEDDPYGVIPKFLSTERPDRVAYGLSEGQVAIFVGHSPFVLVAPVMFWSLLHTSEDAYLRWPFGSFVRMIRVASLIIALFLPALYIAVTNFHPEMIPTDLMLAIAASRERVPFPVVVEILVMEFSIELIREAGIRIPTVIGPTIGIVGALILGQAAVAAGIISPLLIIIVAVTALGSFSLPNYSLSFSVRILRFGFILASAMFGFYGMILGMMLLFMHMATLRSVGVPMLAPIAPRRESSPDTLWRAPAFDMEVRPKPYWPLRTSRQSSVTRPWSPETRDLQETRRAKGKSKNKSPT